MNDEEIEFTPSGVVDIDKRDAERYRWLKGQINTRDKMVGYCIREWYYSSTCDKATLDEAIDASLAAIIDRTNIDF